jgi:hypothetical protein
MTGGCEEGCQIYLKEGYKTWVSDFGLYCEN